MTRSLGSASSIPREGTPQTPAKEAARGGEAEPNDWSDMWITLADRMAIIAHLRSEREAWDEHVSLIFDQHDQARLA